MLQPGTAQPLAGQIGREKRERRPVVALVRAREQAILSRRPVLDRSASANPAYRKTDLHGGFRVGTKTPTPATSSNRGTGTGIPAGVRAFARSPTRARPEPKKT